MAIKPVPVSNRSKLVYVEDILQIVMDNYIDVDFSEAVLSDQWFDSFITNVYAWAIASEKPLTTEQARITLRVLTKIRHVLVDRGWSTDAAINAFLADPIYRRQPTQSANIPREVRYLGDNLFGFRFKRNDVLIAALKAIEQGNPEWDWVSRVWIIEVNRHTIQPIMAVIRDFRFGFDDDVARYLALLTNSAEEASHFYIEPSSGKIIGVVNDHAIIGSWIIEVLGGTARAHV